MSKICREIVFTFKNCFRDKGFVFWSIFYPIILCGFFYMAFSSVLGERTLEFDVGMAPANTIRPYIEQTKAFNIIDVEEDEAEQALKDKKIIAYIHEDMNMTVSQSGTGQTVIQNVLRMMKQTTYLFKNGGNPAQVNFGAKYIEEHKQQHSAYTLIFYSLLAMVSFYGIFGGIMVMENFQANTSEIAKRMVVSPIHKGRFILINMTVIFILNVLSNTLLILFINYVLGIELFTDFAYSYILVLCGNLWGISFGVLIGCIGRLSSGMRTAIGVVIPLLLSSFAGMMSPDIKLMVMDKLPLLNLLNPATIITDGLYRVNLLDNHAAFWQGAAIILGMSFLFYLVSLNSLRRKSYDTF